jgi:hypothetical protein
MPGNRLSFTFKQCNMTVNGFTPANYAAQINNTTVITRAYQRKNAIAYLRTKGKVKAKDVYNYYGIIEATTVDEVYSEEVSEWDSAQRCIVHREVYKVRMKEEYSPVIV